MPDKRSISNNGRGGAKCGIVAPTSEATMERLAAETAIRIRTGTEHAIPEGLRQKRPRSEIKLDGKTPLEAQTWTKSGCLMASPRSVAGRWESRWAFIRAPW